MINRNFQNDDNVVTASVPFEPVARRMAQFVLALIALLATMGLVIALVDQEATWGERAFWLTWAAIMVAVVHLWGFRMALRTELSPQGVLRYRTAFRSRSVHLDEVESIRSRVGLAAFVIVHSRGRINLVSWADNVPGLVEELRRRNPTIVDDVAGWLYRLNGLGVRLNWWPFRLRRDNRRGRLGGDDRSAP